MDLFIFTNFFPFKRSEPFLVNEFPFAKRFSENITILALYGKKEDSVLQQTDSLTILSPVFAGADKKVQIFLKGIMNTSPLNFHLMELRKKSVLLHPKKLYWYIISLCITRAALASPSLKSLISQVEKSPDPVLYFYWGDNLSWIIPYLKRKIKNKNLKIVMRLHGSDLYEEIKGNYAPLREEIFYAADRVFTVSSHGKKYLDVRYPEFSSKIKVSRLGINDHGVNNEKATTAFRVLSVSNLVALKRVSLIFQSLQLLDFPIEWHHFGDGPLRNELNDLVKSSKANVKIVFHGFVRNNELMTYLRNNYFDVFINVSTSEGLPVSVMEAFSFGIPAIATNVGGTSELVDDETGRLVNVNVDAKQLSNEIENYFRLDSNSVAGKRRNARIRFEQLVNAEENYRQFYSEIVRNFGE